MQTARSDHQSGTREAYTVVIVPEGLSIPQEWDVVHDKTRRPCVVDFDERRISINKFLDPEACVKAIAYGVGLASNPGIDPSVMLRMADAIGRALVARN